MKNDEIVPGFDEITDNSLKIMLQQVDDKPTVLVFHLTGYIDTYNSDHFQKKVTRAIENDFTRLIFNCNGLNYISSTGIGAFTTFLRLLKSKGGALILIDVQQKVLEVFQLLGFAQFFTIKDDLNDAITTISESGSTDAPGSFPKVFKCPICSKKLKAVSSGRFRCSECRSIIAVDDSGQVFLG